ncbi:MAG: class I SAM-dependent methyltransferase [Gammaproteobacteria bacterium]|nr:class I SAM-dependent methyltransferase [Gammaproteobacteria bacterium]
MSFLSAFFYDKCMKATEDACLIDWRKDLLKNVEGKVLELGAGTGASLELYPVSKSLEISLSEPDINMRYQLEEKIRSKQFNHMKVLSCQSESITSADGTFDFVFVSLVCCSLNDVEASLKEIKRVLKPDGKFIFLEHVAAENGSGRRKWQDRLNPIWRKLAGNCHLNRETERYIKAAGFTVHELKHESMRKAMPLVRPTIRGIAKKS